MSTTAEESTTAAAANLFRLHFENGCIGTENTTAAPFEAETPLPTFVSVLIRIGADRTGMVRVFSDELAAGRSRDRSVGFLLGRIPFTDETMVFHYSDILAVVA